MANYQASYIRVKSAEGGYNDSAADKGNYYCTGSLAWAKGDYPNYYCTSGTLKFVGTNKGIAAPVLANYLGREISVSDMKNLSSATVRNIFQVNFWNRIKGDDIYNQYVADILFDGAVNHGVSKGVKLLQEVLGVTRDGIVGPNTLQAINSNDPAQVYHLYKQRRIQFYYEIVNARPSQQVFLNGWLNRMADFNDFNEVVVVDPIADQAGGKTNTVPLLFLIGVVFFYLKNKAA